MSLMYRMDGRNVEEFEKDLNEAHLIERQIIDLYAEYIQYTHGIKLKIEDNGVDNSGKLIRGRVTSDADFLVNGKLVEVKFNRKMSDKFHLKVGQVNSYLKQGAVILFVNGWETENPVFTLLSNHDLLLLQQGCKPFPFFIWGNKLVYRLYTTDYNWKPLKRKSGEECTEFMKNMTLQVL